MHDELARLDADLDDLIQQSPVWRAREERLQSVPGSGPVMSRPVWAERPEWGLLTRQQSAALVGVAPFNRERGRRRGHRTIGGVVARLFAECGTGPRWSPRGGIP